MDDLLYLLQRYAVTIRVDNRSMGTSVSDISLDAVVSAENSERKLTAHSMVWGKAADAVALREGAVLSSLARLRRQVEALEGL